MHWPSYIVGAYEVGFVVTIRVDGRARRRCLRSDPFLELRI